MSISLTVMTFNLHEDQPENSPNSWQKRRDLCISLITSYSPMILCTQQGVKSQLEFLQEGLPGEDGSCSNSVVDCVIAWSPNSIHSNGPSSPFEVIKVEVLTLKSCIVTAAEGGKSMKAAVRIDKFGYRANVYSFERLNFSSSTHTHHPMSYIDTTKKICYDHFGVSRKGSQDTSDQHCTIFYDKEKVELLQGGTFWLSESPSVPGSISWGSMVPCIATWAIFQLKGVEQPGFSFQIVNTNMDELSPHARRRSALLTWQHIASLPPTLPVVYCGGFNTQKESTTGRFLLGRSREHGVVGDMRDAWPNARVRKNVSLIHTYHGFKGDKQGAREFLKLMFRALCLCWDRQTQDLHVDWVLYRGRSLIPVSSEIVNDHINDLYPSSHYPVFAEFMLPRTVRLLEPPPIQPVT